MTVLALSDWPIARRMVATTTVVCDYFETIGSFTESAVDIYPHGSLIIENLDFNPSGAYEQ